MADIKVEGKSETGTQVVVSARENNKIAITNCEVISSYTWLNEEEPTIGVPGLPAEWSRTRDVLIKADTGWWILDHNLFHYPSSPMGSGIYAVLHLHPNFDFTKLDVVSDKQPLALLLNLAYAYERGQRPQQQGKSGEKKFEAQVIGNMVVFTRGDGKDSTKADEGFRGFRRGFNEQYLTQAFGFEDGEAHFGMTSYDLSGLKIMVRHSVDASMVPGSATPDDSTYATGPRFSTTDSGLTLYSGGSLMQLEDMAELNTFTNRNSARRTDKQREAWISQCGHFIAAEPEETTRYGTASARDGFSHRRAYFYSDKMDFDRPAQPPANVVTRYHDYVVSIVQTVRKLAVESETSLFTISLDSLSGEPVISDRSGGPALPKELCERIMEVKSA